MLSGALGCGKTMLTRVYIQKLPREHFDIALITNPSPEPLEFLYEVLYQFNIANGSKNKTQCLRLLNDNMYENMKENVETLLIVGEAQLLSEMTFEEIRLLLNFQLDHLFLITVILVGQPELGDKIKGMEQLDQRIAVKYHLPPFNLKKTTNYIFFRLKKAASKENVFSPDAIKRIYAIPKGVPRKINNL